MMGTTKNDAADDEATDDAHRRQLASPTLSLQTMGPRMIGLWMMGIASTHVVDDEVSNHG